MNNHRPADTVRRRVERGGNVPRILAGASAFLALAMVAASCGGSSGGGTGGTTGAAKPRLTVNRLVSTLNGHLQPDHFAIVHRFASGETNVSSDSHTYGHFVVEFSVSGVNGATWGKDHVEISPGGRSGNFVAFGFGGKGLCDYVKSYGTHLFVVYDTTTKRAACGGTAAPKGDGWKLVDQTLSRLAQATS